MLYTDDLSKYHCFVKICKFSYGRAQKTEFKRIIPGI